MTAKKIMLIDDDLDILDLLGYNLMKEEYEVLKVSHSKNAITKAVRFLPDLIIIDVMMPAIDGIELCRKIRMLEEFKLTHIMFLSAISNLETKMRAFENGGNDYLEKRFEIKILMKKINFILKEELKIDKQKNTLRSGKVTFLRSSYTVIVNGIEIILTDNEFEILYLMAQNSQTIFSHKTLIEVLWGGETYMSFNDLNKYIMTIHHKVSPSIITIKPTGYCFNGFI